MPATAAFLRDLLLSLTDRVCSIEGLSLVDRNGLPLVSTLDTGDLDETLAAYGGLVTSLMAQARRDLRMGSVSLLHLQARERQLFVVPVTSEVCLAALVDAAATPATITTHLLALSREIVPHLEPD